MAYVITDECVSCGTCAGECPVEAIAEGDSHYEINPDVYKKGSLSQTSFFYAYVSKLTEKPAPAEHSLLPLHFHVPAEMLQRPGRRIPVCRTRKECCRPC